MKQISLTIIFAVLLLLVVDTLPQDKQQKEMAQYQQMQMMELMKDSAAVNTMMTHIFADSHLRMKMMQKMMQHAKSDSAGLMPMCKMITEDKEMHTMLTKLLDEQKQDSNSTAEEIIIKFNSAVKAAQISELESEFGLKQIKTIPELNLRVFRITSTKNVDEVIAGCEKKPFVRYAELNQQVNALAAKEK